LVAADRRCAWSSRFSVRLAGRVHAALTALTFVLSSLAGLVHTATTRHVQCAEHGEQIHSDAAPAIVVAAGEVASGTAQATVRGQPTAAIHGHEHCLMASATRESRIAPAPLSLAITNHAADALHLVARRVATLHHDPVYRTAPKTSPPA
jgi:hypothetical protein